MSILLEKDIVYMRIWKCGGTWIEFILRNLGLQRENHKIESPTLNELPDNWKNCKKFAFVRNPYSWYQSIWVMHREIGRELRLDSKYPSKIYDKDNFDNFIECFLNDNPNFLTLFYKGRIGEKFNSIEKIYRCEDGVENQLKNFLNEEGLSWNEQIFKNTMRINRTYEKKPDYSDKIRSIVYNNEKEIFDFFNYKETI